MIAILLTIMLMSIAAEAISEIITSSTLFVPLHKSIFKRAYPTPPVDTTSTKVYSWIYGLITCGYCTSVWVSIFMVLLVGAPPLVGSLVTIFVIHRVSNWIHVVYELIRKGRVISISLNLEDQYGTTGTGSAEGATQTES